MADSLPAADTQSEVIDFLSRSGSYGLRAGVVEQIETHCSIVFLVADRAYKLKRALRYASLDYTSRERRQSACEAEFALNRRTAPELYLRVRSINRDANGALAFDGPGPAMDHVVVMRRFAQSGLFDRMAEAGSLTPEQMRTLGKAVAQLHLSAEITPAFGGSVAIRRVIDDNDRELAKVAMALNGAAVGALSDRTRAALDAVADLLDRRRTEGKVRRCHGDLRLANICLYAGRPTLFDCIEFSDEIGCIDTLFDLAFLLMDLHLRDRGDLANAAFNAYLDVVPEIAGLRALPLFLALRAATRSYALAGSAGRQTSPRQAARRLALARRHIGAGLGFLVPQRPLLIVLGGDAESRRRDLAAALAGLAPPAPGARLLQWTSSAELMWREASETLAAGISVLIEGEMRPAVMQTDGLVQAGRHADRLVAFWFGPFRPDLDQQFWHRLDVAEGVLAAVANAAPLLAAPYQESVPAEV